VKQTIAWIGNNNREEDTLWKLAERYRLLLVRKKGEPPIPIFEQKTGLEVEMIDCAKDGCWEADIIVLAEEGMQEDLLTRISEVAIQKTVLIMDGRRGIGGAERRPSIIGKVLPFSKIVEVALHSGEAVLSGKNPAALDTAAEIIRLIGYSVKVKGLQV